MCDWGIPDHGQLQRVRAIGMPVFVANGDSNLSVLAAIQAKWNLPVLTRREANASTILDFLDIGAPLLHTPAISGPAVTGPSGPVATAP